jgi:hypothetical protein
MVAEFLNQDFTLFNIDCISPKKDFIPGTCGCPPPSSVPLISRPRPAALNRRQKPTRSSVIAGKCRRSSQIEAINRWESLSKQPLQPCR